MSSMLVRSFVAALGGLALATTAPAAAQGTIRTVDPNVAANADLAPVSSPDPSYDPAPASPPVYAPPPAASTTTAGTGTSSPTGELASEAAASADTYQQDDLMAAAEGVFGKGAEGLAKLIENLLRDQGEPNAYIVGREVGAAIAVGLRYGSGTIFHKVEGNRPIYWTGPSLGFDLGASGSKSFMLVYNLHDGEDIFERFPGGEGVVYLVGGFNASYQRRNDVVVIPIRMGVGWRLGANVGYLKFTKNHNLLPF